MPCSARELAADRRLLVVGVDAGEDEVIVGDGRLPRIDRVAAGDLVEGVDRERRGAVGGRQQVGVDAQRRARRQIGRPQILVDAMRPDDLLGRRHLRGGVRLGPVDDGARQRPTCGTRAGRPRRSRRCGGSLLPSATAAPGRRSCPASRFAAARRQRIERELVAVLRVGDGLRALHDVQAEVEAVAAEDVAHVVAADDHHLQAGFFGDALEPGRAHLARRADGEAIAGDDEGLAAVHARAEVRHQVAERSRLPALVERLEALGHAVGGRRDLIGVDGVELLRELCAREAHRIPEDERASGDRWGMRRLRVVCLDGRRIRWQGADRHVRFQPRGFNSVHTPPNASKPRRH